MAVLAVNEASEQLHRHYAASTIYNYSTSKGFTISGALVIILGFAPGSPRAKAGAMMQRRDSIQPLKPRADGGSFADSFSLRH